MNKTTISIALTALIAINLSACDKIKALGGDDEIATQCLVFGQAEKLTGGYKHLVKNTCDKQINVLEKSTEQRFTLVKKGEQNVILFEATTSMGACFEPYEPDIKSSNGKFQCRKK
ncbi:MAG: hypothetical protein V3V09_07400 [Arenicellales bacterium]